jgi:Bacterial pre-peptidase C-terminal domain/Metallo-peptidase family M12B Reprolysin-like
MVAPIATRKADLMRTKRILALGVVAAVGLTAVATLATAEPPAFDQGGIPGALDRSRQGQDALDRLGERLPEVAAINGKSVGEFRTLLRGDDTVWVDPTGRLFYVDPERAGGATEAITTQAAPFPLDDTFRLHSRPGASRTIFLDFDGHTVSGTAWNTGSLTAGFFAEQYTIDADPLTFNDAEREQIQLTWARMAEDYAPFDVDVTTEEPSFDAINRSNSTDNVFGTRVLVSGANEYSSICPRGCGGVAYVGTYDVAGTAHAYYQPAWVFTQGVGTGAKNISEAGSHEAGHNLGLSHDGTSTVDYYRGHGAWAPIMGVGYSEPVTQWSRGEYAGANNLEDDFAVIQSNGGPLRPDDVGGTLGTATPLGAGPTIAVGGVIHSRTDVDVFQVSVGAGTATFSVNPAATGPNLDVKLELLDAAGVVVASNDPAVAQVDAANATGQSATVTASVGAGTYYVRVDGVGFADPLSTGYSDYGSVGTYRLTGTFVVGSGEPPASTTTTSAPTTTAPTTTTPTTTVPPQPPLAPESVTVSGSRTVSISWPAVAGATRYDVQRQPVVNGVIGTAKIVRNDVTGTSTTNKPGQGTWIYSVRAENAAGSSAWTPSGLITTTR